MADDPYTVLGVSRTASDDDIRRAFRRLAKELHPDLKPDDAAAADRFKKVSQAYDILGDAEKRKQFDRGEIGADGEPRRAYTAAGGPGGFGGAAGGYGQRPRSPVDDMGFGDIFSDLFGAGVRPGPRGRSGFGMRGQDARYTLEVDFSEAITGAKKRVTMPDGGILDITVPAGVTDGQVLRLRGKGSPGIGEGEAGDAMVEVKVRAHPNFERDGLTIRSNVAISLDEAILGAKIAVPTVSGQVQVTIPKGTSSGQALRLRGKGVRNAATGEQGDHLVTVQIVLPKKIDESLSYFISEWREKHGYNPRNA